MTVPSNVQGPTTLKQRVEAAADAMLSQGVRPNLALVCASVRGPRHQVSKHLDEWALRRRTRAGHAVQRDELARELAFVRSKLAFLEDSPSPEGDNNIRAALKANFCKRLASLEERLASLPTTIE